MKFINIEIIVIMIFALSAQQDPLMVAAENCTVAWGTTATNAKGTTSITDGGCQTITATKCRSASGVSTNMDATPWYGWKSATDPSCVKVTATTCRCPNNTMETHAKKSGSSILCADDSCVPTGKCKCSATSYVTATCKSATDKWVKDAEFAAKCLSTTTAQCVDISSHTINSLAATYGWTTSTSGYCASLGSGNCRKADKTLDSLSGLKVKTSTTDGTCLTTTAVTKCKDTNGAQVDIGTKAWTGADDATCATVVAANCRNSSSKLSVTFTNAKTGKKSSTDSECASAATTQCRNATSGVLQAFGTQAWKSANEQLCTSVQANLNCRDASAPQLAKAFTNDKTGWASNSNAECTAAVANAGSPAGTDAKCRNATVGYLETAGKQAWTSAANAVCLTVDKSANCRNATTGASEAYANSLKGWFSANSALCTAANTKCRDTTGVMVAFGTNAWTGSADGSCKAVGTSDCRDTTSFETTATTINKSKLDTSDSACSVLASEKKCMNSSTKILEDLGNQIWNTPAPDVTCKPATANKCRKTGGDQGVEENVAFTPAPKARTSATNAECIDPTTGCMTAITGVTVPFDAAPTFQSWNGANNKTCAALGDTKCRHTDKIAQTDLNTDGTAIRVSDINAECQAAQTTKCVAILAGTSNNSKYWETFTTASPFTAMTSSGDKTCVDLTTSQCRNGSTPFEAVSTSVTKARKSTTDAECSDLATEHCIKTDTFRQWVVAGKNAWTANADKTCVAVAAATNCRKDTTNFTSQAFGNNKTGWTTADNAKCLAITSSNCRNATSAATEAFTANDSAWTAADNYTCVAVGTSNCRDSNKLSVAFSTFTSPDTASKKGKKTSDSSLECETTPSTQCKNTTSGKNENFDIAAVPSPAAPARYQAWTSTNDYTCAALSSTTCRKATSPYDAIAFANAKTGWTSSSNGKCNTTQATECRNASSGANEALAKKAWTSADSFVCLNVAQGANCRDSNKISVVFASNKIAWTSAADAKCLEPINANCRNRGTGISEALGLKARTSSSDQRCNILHANCRDATSKLATTFTTTKTGMKSQTDIECATATDSQCISSASTTASVVPPIVANTSAAGQIVAIGSNAWSSADDATCNGMLDNYCRDGTTKLGKWFSSTGKEGRKSSTDALCANATDSQCRNVNNLQALGIQKWKSTDDATCTDLKAGITPDVANNLYCRTDKKTAILISSNASQDARASNTDAICQKLKALECRTATNGMMAMNVVTSLQSWTSAGTSTCSALSAGNCRKADYSGAALGTAQGRAGMGDPTCATLDTGMCRCPASMSSAELAQDGPNTSGACTKDFSCKRMVITKKGSCSQAILNYGWKSATDSTCLAMKTDSATPPVVLVTECRCKDGTIKSGTRGTGQACNATTEATCTAIPTPKVWVKSTKCHQAMGTQYLYTKAVDKMLSRNQTTGDNSCNKLSTAMTTKCRHGRFNRSLNLGSNQGWKSATDATCVLITAGNCRCGDKTVKTGTANLSATNQCVDECMAAGQCKCGAIGSYVTGTRTSTTDMTCTPFKTCATATKCFTGTTVHDLAAAQGWTKTDDKTCKALGTLKCRKSDKTVETFLATTTKSQKSSTDGSCHTVGDTQCRTAASQAQAIGTKAWTSKTDVTCADVTATNCRTTDKTSIAFANTKTGQKSATDAACTTTTDTQCRNATTGVLEAIGSKAWTSKDSAVCATNAATNCRGSNKLSAAFADGKTGIKSATDASCTAVSNAQCRNATTGVVEAIGAQAWTSATSAVCKAVVAANCRDSGNLSIVFADKKTGQKSTTDTSCTSASDTQCRNATTGVLEALGTNKWAAADSAVCTAMTDVTKCRNAKLTELAFGEGSDARKSATDQSCHTLAATECLEDANKQAIALGAVNAAGTGQARTSATDKKCVALTATQCVKDKLAVEVDGSTLQGWKAAKDATCVALTSGTNCRCPNKVAMAGADGHSIACSNTLKDCDLGKELKTGSCASDLLDGKTAGAADGGAGGLGQKSAGDQSCVWMKSTECRCPKDSTVRTGTRTALYQTCKDAAKVCAPVPPTPGAGEGTTPTPSSPPAKAGEGTATTPTSTPTATAGETSFLLGLLALVISLL